MPVPVRPDATPTPPAGEPSLAMLTSLAGRPAGATDDDPLTSPSFSRPTPDSRSYAGSRRNGQASDTGDGTHANGSPAAAAYGDTGYASDAYGNGDYADSRPDDQTPVNGAYKVPDHSDPGYAYAPAGWYGAPAHTPAHGTPAQSPPPVQAAPAQGNPYGSYVDPPSAASYPSTPPMGYQDQHAGAALPAYPGGQGGGYTEPGYGQAASLPYPGQTAAGAPEAPGHPSGGGQPAQPAAYPEAGYPPGGGYGNEYPGQAPYAESYGAAGIAPGYAADQHGPDGYGYPAGQG